MAAPIRVSSSKKQNTLDSIKQYSVKTESHHHVDVYNYVILLTQMLKEGHKPIIVCRIGIVSAKRSFSKIGVWNHQDNYFLRNVGYRNDANLTRWPHATIFVKFEL